MIIVNAISRPVEATVDGVEGSEIPMTFFAISPSCGYCCWGDAYLRLLRAQRPTIQTPSRASRAATYTAKGWGKDARATSVRIVAIIRILRGLRLRP